MVFGVLAWTLGLWMSYVVVGLLLIGVGGLASAGPEEQGDIAGFFFTAGGGITVLSPIFAALAGPAGAVFGIALSSGCAHGTLALFKKTGAPFEETLRAVSYSYAPHLWSFVPVLGVITPLWAIAVEIIALRETHSTTTGWASFASLGYRAIFTVLLASFYLAVIVLTLVTVPSA